MNYLVFIMLIAISFTGCVVNSQTTEKNLNKLNSPDSKKSAMVDADWKQLTENSKLIVTGYAEESLYVVDEKKLYEKKPVPDGIVQLPNLKEGVKGILVRFRTEEVLYAEKDYEINGLINIYVHDGYSIKTDSNTPRFTKGEKYLVFLSSLEKADDVKDATVIQPLDLSKGSFVFDYKSAFKVTKDINSYFNLTRSTDSILDEVRSVIKQK